MNPSGCQRGLATDTAFQPNIPGACDTSIAGFYVLCLSTGICSLVAAVRQTQNWLRRKSHTSRLPRGPINSFVFAVGQIINVILIGNNILNYHNGLSFMLFSILFLNFAYSYSLGIIRLVALGERIIPKIRNGGEASNMNLRTFDGLGKILFVLQIAFLFASSFALIIMSPIFNQNKEVISRVGWGAKSLFIFLCQCGYWYQFERCIRVIRIIQKSDADIRSEGIAVRAQQLERAVYKMRQNQATHVLATVAVIVFGLIAVGAINGSIWPIYASALSQSFGAIFFEFSIKHQKRSGGTSDGDNNKKVDVHMAIDIGSPASSNAQ